MLYVNPLESEFAARLGSMSQDARERRVALKELEQYFLQTLLTELRKSVPKDGLFPETFETQMHEQMLDEALSEAIAESGQFGIAKGIEEQIRQGELQKRTKATVDERSGRELGMPTRALLLAFGATPAQPPAGDTGRPLHMPSQPRLRAPAALPITGV